MCRYVCVVLLCNFIESVIVCENRLKKVFSKKNNYNNITYNTYVTSNVTYNTIVAYTTVNKNTTNATDTLPTQLFFPVTDIVFLIDTYISIPTKV